MVAEIGVHLDTEGGCPRIGLLRTYPRQGTESVTFEYDVAWASARDRFAIEPSLPVLPGIYRPAGNPKMFGARGDTARTLGAEAC